MKRIMALLMAVSVLFSLVGCNKSSYRENDNVSKRGPSAESVTEEIVSEEESENDSLFSSEEETVSSEEEIDTATDNEKKTTSSKAVSEDDESLIPKSVKDPDTIEMSDNLFDYTVEIEGKVYQLPMTVNDLLADGWELNLGNNEDVPANKYIESISNIFVNKDGKGIAGAIANYSNRKLNAKYCYIVSFSYYNEEYNEGKNVDLKLAKGIDPMKSSADDVKKAYGVPSESSSSLITYKENDSYLTTYSFGFDKDGKMKSVEIRNQVDKPANFVEAEVSNDVPDYVADYKAPDKLGDDILSGNVQIDNVVYRLPCPTQVFLDNGWKIDTDSSADKEATVVSGKKADISLSKYGYKIQVYARNYTDYEIPVENTIIDHISFYPNEVSDMDLKLPGGIDMNVTKEQLAKSKDFKLMDTSAAFGYVAIEEGADYYDDVNKVTATWYDGEDKIGFLVMNFKYNDD